MSKSNQEKEVRTSVLPEHGPVDENGKEILLSLRNVDITFGREIMLSKR